MHGADEKRESQAVVERLAALLGDIRTTYLRGFPLTVVLELGPPAAPPAGAAQQFLQQARELLGPADEVWLLGRGPRPAHLPAEGYLNLEETADKGLASTLVADLLVIAAVDGAALRERLTAWERRARAVLAVLVNPATPAHPIIGLLDDGWHRQPRAA